VRHFPPVFCAAPRTSAHVDPPNFASSPCTPRFLPSQPLRSYRSRGVGAVRSVATGFLAEESKPKIRVSEWPFDSRCIDRRIGDRCVERIPARSKSESQEIRYFKSTVRLDLTVE
jgi:hypothetical protein